jgi:hypothetical protein
LLLLLLRWRLHAYKPARWWRRLSRLKVACDLRILLLLMLLLMLPTAAFVVAWFSFVEAAVAAARSNERPSLRK